MVLSPRVRALLDRGYTVLREVGRAGTDLAPRGTALVYLDRTSGRVRVTEPRNGDRTLEPTATADAALAGTVSTTDATVSTAATYDVPDLSTAILRVTVAAHRDTHAQAAGYVLAATFRRSGGTVTQVGATSVLHSAEDDAAWDAALDVSTTTVRVRVTGAAATNIAWQVRGDVVLAD